MAKISWNNIDHTPSAAPSGNGDTKESKFLKLVNHGDKAHVRFLINKLEDIEIYTTHRAHVKTQTGKEWDTTVECLRSSSDQPVDACPFCEAGLKPKTELYMQLYDVDSNSLRIWTRPTSFAERLRAAFSAVQNMNGGKPLCSAVFEITRIGERGSKQTEYTIYPISFDDTTLESLPVRPIDVHTSGCLREVDWEGAQHWKAHGDFPVPEKTSVDQWGRPIDQPQPQVYNHQPTPMPMPAPQPQLAQAPQPQISYVTPKAPVAPQAPLGTVVAPQTPSGVAVAQTPADPMKVENDPTKAQDEPPVRNVGRRLRF